MNTFSMYSGVRLTCNAYYLSTYEWGCFWPRLHSLKDMLGSWFSKSKQIWNRSFNWSTIDFGQGIAYISKGQKIIYRFGPGSRRISLKYGRVSNFYFQLWPQVFFQLLHQKECLVPCLKDIFRTCLEPENQSHGMIFTVWNLGPN